MINGCDPLIASWTDDGDMIEIKDQDRFAEEAIPQFFNHNNFSSFARQLNFYGFCKIPSRELRIENDDGNNNNNNNIDNCPSSSSSVVTFRNEFFKRDNPELMKSIKRSTKHPSNAQNDQQEEIESLRNQIKDMQREMGDMEKIFEDQIVIMEDDFRSRIERIRKDFVAGTGTQSNANRSDPSTEPVVGCKEFEQSWENRRMEVMEESAKETKNVKKKP